MYVCVYIYINTGAKRVNNNNNIYIYMKEVKKLYITDHIYVCVCNVCMKEGGGR